MSIDYEKIAADVEIEGLISDQAPEPSQEELLRAARQPLRLDDPKYQGIAEAKGYEQHDNRLKRVHYSHEAMIEVIIANPTITQGELAKQFGKSQGWISVVMGSDAFQAALAKRRDDISDPFLVATVEERLRGVVDQSLQILAEKLEQTKNADLALESLKVGAKALGYGARKDGNVTNNTYVVALPPKSASAESWVQAHAPAPLEIDAKPSKAA